MKRVFIVFVILVAAISTALYLRLRKQAEEAARPSGGSATVEGTEVDIVVRIPDRILRIAAEEGDSVEAGAVLVELECKEPRAALAQAEAAVAAGEAGAAATRVGVDIARNAVDTADRQHDAASAVAKATRSQRKALQVQKDAASRAAKRIETVLSAGGSTEQQLDQAQSQAAGIGKQMAAVEASALAADAQARVVASGRGTAELQVKLGEAQVTAAEKQVDTAKAAVERAKVAVAECTLTAPRAGVVLTRSYEPGEAVNPGARVLTLVDISEVEATFFLPNAELGAAAPGRAVEVVADAFPDRVFAGEIRRVGTEAEFTPRNVQTREDRDRLVYAIEVAIPNADAALRPGMPVEVRIPGTEREP